MSNLPARRPRNAVGRVERSNEVTTYLTGTPVHRGGNDLGHTGYDNQGRSDHFDRQAAKARMQMLMLIFAGIVALTISVSIMTGVMIGQGNSDAGTGQLVETVDKLVDELAAEREDRRDRERERAELENQKNRELIKIIIAAVMAIIALAIGYAALGGGGLLAVALVVGYFFAQSQGMLDGL